MAELFISAHAEADLDEIRDFGDERFGLSVSDEYVVGFLMIFNQILDNPEQSRIYAGYRKTQLRSVVYRRHRIFYDVTPHAIRIVRILHQAMDFDRHFD